MHDWYKMTAMPSSFDPVMQDYFKLHKQIENGKFWYDEIKKMRTESTKRLDLALKSLPLPAAFREAAKALRTLIRESKKIDEDYSTYIEQLYKIACIRSFMLDYAPVLKMPGYNVMLSIPGGLLFSLKLDYYIIGVEKLELLNATDRKMMVEKWGDAKEQKTMNEVYRNIWDRAEDKMTAEENNRRRKFL